MPIFGDDRPLSARTTLPASAAGWAWGILLAATAVNWFQAHFWHVPHNTLLSNVRTATGDALAGLAVSALLFLLTRLATGDRSAKLLLPVLSFLSWKPLVFIGTFAYSIYLIHILVIYRIEDFLSSLLHTHSAFVLFPITAALVIPVAYLFHLVFERPFMSKPGTAIKTEAQAEVAAVVNPAP